MKKFEIVVCACGTLEIVARHIVEAKDVDLARKLGIVRYSQPNYFVGAQAI